MTEDVTTKEAFKDSVRRAREEITKSAKNAIQRLAQDFERLGMPIQMISTEVTRNLSDIVSDRYIRETLPDKYKNKKNVRKIAEPHAANVGKKVILQTSNGNQVFAKDTAIEPKPEQTYVPDYRIATNKIRLDKRKLTAMERVHIRDENVFDIIFNERYEAIKIK